MKDIEYKDLNEYHRVYRCPCCKGELSLFEVLCTKCLISGKGSTEIKERIYEIKKLNYIPNALMYFATTITIMSLCLAIHFAKVNNDKDREIKILEKEISIVKSYPR